MFTHASVSSVCVCAHIYEKSILLSTLSSLVMATVIVNILSKQIHMKTCKRRHRRQIYIYIYPSHDSGSVFGLSLLGELKPLIQ